MVHILLLVLMALNAFFAGWMVGMIGEMKTLRQWRETIDLWEETINDFKEYREASKELRLRHEAKIETLEAQLDEVQKKLYAKK